jgi:hypothetical protein
MNTRRGIGGFVQPQRQRMPEALRRQAEHIGFIGSKDVKPSAAK